MFGFVVDCRSPNDFKTHLCSSLISGAIATLIAAPIDYIKTRIQGQPVSADGKALLFKYF